MHSDRVNTVWIDPPKYWAATADMTDEQKASLLEKIEQLAESGDTNSLQQIDFVFLGGLRDSRPAKLNVAVIPQRQKRSAS